MFGIFFAVVSYIYLFNIVNNTREKYISDTPLFMVISLLAYIEIRIIFTSSVFNRASSESLKLTISSVWQFLMLPNLIYIE